MDNEKELVWKKLKEKPLFRNADGGWPEWADGTRITIEEQKHIAEQQGWMLTSNFLGYTK